MSKALVKELERLMKAGRLRPIEVRCACCGAIATTWLTPNRPLERDLARCSGCGGYSMWSGDKWVRASDEDREWGERRVEAGKARIVPGVVTAPRSN